MTKNDPKLTKFHEIETNFPISSINKNVKKRYKKVLKWRNFENSSTSLKRRKNLENPGVTVNIKMTKIDGPKSDFFPNKKPQK